MHAQWLEKLPKLTVSRFLLFRLGMEGPSSHFYEDQYDSGWGGSSFSQGYGGGGSGYMGGGGGYGGGGMNDNRRRKNFRGGKFNKRNWNEQCHLKSSATSYPATKPVIIMPPLWRSVLVHSFVRLHLYSEDWTLHFFYITIVLSTCSHVIPLHWRLHEM